MPSTPRDARFAVTALTLLAVFFALGCEGELGFSASRTPVGEAPTLMPGTDAGPRADAAFASSDAHWQAPDAFVPPSCTPQCAGRACGNDGCGGSCGTCGAGTTCNPSNQCEPTAPPTGGTHAVTLYGTSSCGYCIRARQFFDANDVTFTDRDLNAPGVVDEAFERVHALTGEYRVSTPTVIIDNEVMLGWSEAECRRLLGL